MITNIIIDISHWQNVDWSKIKLPFTFNSKMYQVVGVFIKSSQGNDYHDPLFLDHIRGAISVGLPYGFYHFTTPTLQDAAMEAANFINTTAMFKNPPLGYVLDLENNNAKLSDVNYSNWCKTFIAALQKSGLANFLIYGSPGNLNDWLVQDPMLDSLPLWVADYSSVGHPKPVTGWKSWKYWQFTENGVHPAVSGSKCDFNLINPAP